MSHKIALYKYKPLATVEELKHLEDTLKQSVWMPPISTLNDPFEGCFQYEFTSPRFVLSNPDIFDFFLKYRRNNGEPDLTEAAFRTEIQTPEFAKALRESPISNELIRNLFENHSVLSFTSCPSNIPMWAHYANYHQGYSIIFELDFSVLFSQQSFSTKEQEDFKNRLLYNEEEEENEEIIFYRPTNPDEIEREFIFAKVRYSNKPPVFSLEKYYSMESSQDRYAKIKYFYQHTVGVKFSQWKYENEFRLVTNSNSKNRGLMDLRIYAPFLKVTGIIMGDKLQARGIFYDLCQKYNADLYEAVCSEKDYRMSLKKILNNGRESNKLKPICGCQCVLA